MKNRNNGSKPIIYVKNYIGVIIYKQGKVKFPQVWLVPMTCDFVNMLPAKPPTLLILIIPESGSNKKLFFLFHSEQLRKE